MLRFKRAAMTAAAALLAVTFFGSTARADVTDLRGGWMGFRQSSVLQGPPDPERSFFEITSQNGRRFTGNVIVGPDIAPGPPIFPIDGTISADNVVNFTGKLGGIHIEAHGKVRNLVPSGPPQIPPGPCRATALTYKIVGPDHSVDDSGFLILLQMQGGPGWASPPDPDDVSGHWAGDFSSGVGDSGGSMFMDLSQIRTGGIDFQGGLTSGFGGILHMENVFIPGGPPSVPQSVDFDILGTVGEPIPVGDSHLSNIALIGLVSPPEPEKPQIIAILIGLMTAGEPGETEPCWDVQYSLYGSFFDIFTEITTGKASSFDMGSAHMMFMPERG